MTTEDSRSERWARFLPPSLFELQRDKLPTPHESASGSALACTGGAGIGNFSNCFGKFTGRRRSWKKAYVCLKPGQEINFAAEG